jgi:hypothetical protein
MENIKITNPDLFTSRKVDVNIDSLSIGLIRGRFAAVGNVHIQFDENEFQTWSGEHGQYDYEEDFGFIFVAEEDEL